MVDVLIIAVLAVTVYFIVRSQLGRLRKGRCCGDCAGCCNSCGGDCGTAESKTEN